MQVMKRHRLPSSRLVAFERRYRKGVSILQPGIHSLHINKVFSSETLELAIFSAAISYGDVITSLPFGNTIDSFELSGQEIIDAFEYSVENDYLRQFRVNKILQVSGANTFFLNS